MHWYMVMTYGDAPKDPAYEVPEEIKNLVIHARLNIDDSVVMFSDIFPGGQYTKRRLLSSHMKS
ncbi:MAG: hypothetical protein K0R00_1473 [Herbinix sp.]|nr:hypothetical protein [Herbinix sp.]